MPTPQPNEKRDEFLKRCIPECMDEGLKQNQTLGKCEGIYDNHMAHKGKK